MRAGHRVGHLHDEYGVTYVCERVTGIRRRWFGLGPRRWGWRGLGRLDP